MLLRGGGVDIIDLVLVNEKRKTAQTNKPFLVASPFLPCTLSTVPTFLTSHFIDS